MKNIVVSPIVKKIAFNISWLLFDKFFRMFSGLAVGIYVANYLGPDKLGMISFYQSVCLVLSAICGCGFSGILVREFVKNESKSFLILTTSFTIKFFVGLTISSFVLIFCVINNYNEKWLVFFLISLSLVFQSLDVLDYYFQSKLKGKFVAKANLLANFSISFFKFLVVYYKLSFLFIVLSFSLEILISGLGFLYFYLKTSYSKGSIKFDLNIAKSLFKDSWPLVFTGLAISINMRIDQVMLKSMLGNEAVGIYAMAIKITSAAMLAPYIIGNAFFPILVKVKEEKEKHFPKYLMRCYVALLSIMLTFCFLLNILSPFLFKNFLSNEFSNSLAIFQLSIFTIFLAAIGVFNSWYLRIHNMQKKILNREWINVFLNIVLNYFLINKFGISGAMIATICAAIFSTVIYDALDRDTIQLFKMKFFIFN